MNERGTPDLAAAREAVGRLLDALGLDRERDPELRGTPERVVEAFDSELLAGYAVDVPALLDSGSPVRPRPEPGGQIVVVRDIAVATTCPHHLMPALGTAAVSYEPGDRLLGIGVLARLVSAHARRLTLQETIGERVVSDLMQHAGCRGARCELRLKHACMAARGEREANAWVETFAAAGTLLAGDRP